jgi:hypothetical protein
MLKPVEFPPIALVDQNVLLLPDRKPYRVRYVEPLPMIVKTFGTISAGGKLEDQDISELEMPAGELGQFRFAPLDDVRIYVKQPKTVGRFLTKAGMVPVDARIWQHDPLLTRTEFYVFENRIVTLNVENPSSAYSVVSPRIAFFGYRLVLEALTEIPERYVAVPIAGWPAK